MIWMVVLVGEDHIPRQQRSAPVNVRPKMRSSFGSTVLGVMVLVISNFDGSMLGSFEARSSSIVNASFLHSDVENVLYESNSDEANKRSGRVLQRSSRGSMSFNLVVLSGQHREGRVWSSRW